MDTNDKLNSLNRLLSDQTPSIKMLNELLNYIEERFKPSDEEFIHISSSLSNLLKQKSEEVAAIFKLFWVIGGFALSSLTALSNPLGVKPPK